MFRMADITAHPQEPVIEAPASEIVLELLLDIPRLLHTSIARWALIAGKYS
jgi:hypothetical protein